MRRWFCVTATAALLAVPAGLDAGGTRRAQRPPARIHGRGAHYPGCHPRANQRDRRLGRAGGRLMSAGPAAESTPRVRLHGSARPVSAPPTTLGVPAVFVLYPSPPLSSPPHVPFLPFWASFSLSPLVSPPPSINAHGRSHLTFPRLPPLVSRPSPFHYPFHIPILFMSTQIPIHRQLVTHTYPPTHRPCIPCTVICLIVPLPACIPLYPCHFHHLGPPLPHPSGTAVLPPMYTIASPQHTSSNQAHQTNLYFHSIPAVRAKTLI